MDNKNSLTERQAIFDIVKFIMALMVVAIHSSLFPMVLYPWLRLAVPMFFIISSYFFFGSLCKLETDKDKNRRWWKYVKRNLILYGFWFVLLLPYTLYVQRYFDSGVLRGTFNFIKSLLFGDTFPASWFIQASIVSVTVIFFASKKIKDRYLFALSFLIYCFAVLRSSYWSVVEDVTLINTAYKVYHFAFSAPMFNASSAFIWIVIGKLFAEKKIRINKIFAIVGILMSSVLLYVEWIFVRALNGSFNNDCYLFLIPTAFFAFQLISLIRVSPNDITVFLGKSSTLIYTTHIPTIAVISLLLQRFLSITDNLLVFVLVVILCTAGSYIVLKLEKMRAFRWLKYSHLKMGLASAFAVLTAVQYTQSQFNIKSTPRGAFYVGWDGQISNWGFADAFLLTKRACTNPTDA